MDNNMIAGMKLVQYPNLVIAHKCGWNIGALACGAEVSKEVMIDVLNSDDDLTFSEKVRLANYIEIDYRVLFAPRISFIDTRKPKWVLFIQGMDQMYTDILNALGEREKPWRLRYYEDIKSVMSKTQLIWYVQLLYAKHELKMVYHDICYKPKVRSKPIRCKVSTAGNIDRWNEQARRHNTEVYTRRFNKQPKDYEEVKAWINSIVKERSDSKDCGYTILPYLGEVL